MDANNLFKNANDLLQTVYETFNKTESETNQDIETIKKWLDTQHHLPEKLRDSHIRNFLILNKFSIERTKQKIDMYYTIRSLIPDYYDECNPKLPQTANLFDNVEAGIHPKLVQNLYRVYMAKITGPAIIPRDCAMTVANTIEVRLHEDCFFYDMFIIDLSNFSLSMMAKFTPDYIMKAVTIYEKVYSFRLKKMYFINSPSYIYQVLNIAKMIMKPKLFERISVHENDEILKEIFSIEDLPKDYGGYGPSVKELTVMLRKKFEEHQDRFDQLDKMRVDESLRPEKLVNDDILGYYGNFKKLDVD